MACLRRRCAETSFSMFVRVVSAVDAKGVKREYVRLVESVRRNGRTMQRTVCNLGRKDVLVAHLDTLNRVLRGESDAIETAPVRAVRAAGAWDWGPILVARVLWKDLDLEGILDRLGGRGASDGLHLSDRAFVLVANRLCSPSSEHGLARWLERDFVCDRRGRRWVPVWRDDEERRRSRLPRVRVELRQLKQWYRTVRQLQERKVEIEHELYLRLRDLFSMKVDFVLYDLTSTYFEGRGPAMAEHGYSRDGRPRNRQVLVGLVLVDGWPIAHHVFRGKLQDQQTVQGVLDDLEKRFGVRRVVFVGDRGMVTSANIERLRSARQGYVVGLQRRRRGKVHDYIRRATGPWTECPVGIAASEKADPPKTQVAEVESGEPGVRVFVVHSDERLAYERGQREKAMGRVRAGLEALQRRVADGQLKAPDLIGAAAARVLSRNHGHRYYDWKLEDGGFEFFEHPVHLPREIAYEGKYLIQTEEAGLSAIEAVEIYKGLSEVERAFSNLKDVLELRPIFHQTDKHVQGHIFVAALAFLLHRMLEKKLKTAGLDLSATEARQALQTVRVVEIELGGGRRKRSITHGSAGAADVLAALGIADLEPPTPPEGASTVT